ncbi:methionyl-tRNA formyltransferase [Oxobacter pfennigii]|uniref:Methionyl-tRNA formyltransferase n=1 Tax=Oxobacter pfennigii TaxID=36849 RepID=A0A0P8YW95_9CLOT|nr:methionyl-tRNA formyltransferase [Oxobacter pfennigii]KPU43978.1 methionyl-tRNA formyltransferase [Oxobacter pfennigii]
MNIVFMGTPEFAVPTLEYLINEKYNILYAVTQPDKPRGRGNKVTYSPVKECALSNNIKVLQPQVIKNDEEFIEAVKKANPDYIVVVAFGQILPKEILDIPKYGCINVHASLLPKLRGAAPINWSIINGDSETGITTMMMDTGLDTGNMLVKEAIKIGEKENSGELHDRLKILGAQTLIKTLKRIESGEIKGIPQEHEKSTYAPMLNKETGKIDWNKGSVGIKNLVRGTNPWPVAYGILDGQKLKIWEVAAENLGNVDLAPGMVWKIDKSGIHVQCKNGGIILKEVQGENGKRTDAHAYTLGHTINIGARFL